MLKERIAENLYWFQSEVYAQVTAGAVIGTNWAVLIDTLALPEESLEIRSYLEDTLHVPVRYIINTHYHADHTFGNCFFPNATVISHNLCRNLMAERNALALEKIRETNPAYNKVKVILPTFTFDSGTLALQVGKKHLKIFSTPGNSPDGISVLVREDRILFAGDAFMPIPFLVEGEIEQLNDTIRTIGKMGLENIVQGHGDIILRGEIDANTRSHLNYLAAIQKAAKTAAKRKDPSKVIEETTIEACGKSRVLLGGLVEGLHRQNLAALYKYERKLITEAKQKKSS